MVSKFHMRLELSSSSIWNLLTINKLYQVNFKLCNFCILQLSLYTLKANNEYKTKNLSSDNKITSSNLGTKPNDIILQYHMIKYNFLTLNIIKIMIIYINNHVYQENMGKVGLSQHPQIRPCIWRYPCLKFKVK